MIHLYRSGEIAYGLESRDQSSLRKVSRAVLERKAMEQDKVDMTLISIAPCNFMYRDYILVDGRPYFLNLLPSVRKEGKHELSYNMSFEGGMYELGRAAFTMAGLHGWDFTGQLYDFCNLVINEMNRCNLTIVVSTENVLRFTGLTHEGYYIWVDAADASSILYSSEMIPDVGSTMLLGDLLPGPVVEQVGGAWTLDFELDQYPSGKPISTEEKLLTYDSHTCLAVMNALMSEYEGWEYCVDVRASDLCNIDDTLPTQCGGRILLRRKKKATADTSDGIFLDVNTIHTGMGYGKKGGIRKIYRNYTEDVNMPSRIYFYGGTQNVPSGYRNTRICLPSSTKEQSYIDTGFSDNATCEAVKTFDDIYPGARPFTVSLDGELRGEKYFCLYIYKQDFFDLTAQWKDPDEATPSEYGSYNEWRLTYGTGDNVTDEQRYRLYYYEGEQQTLRTDYPKSCYIIGDVSITFLTGDLAGMSFKLHEFSGQDASYYEINLLRNGQETPFEDEVNYIPNGDVMCKSGDKFIVEGCIMPASYVYADFGSGNYAAETILNDAAQEYINELSTKIKIGVEISDDYIIANNAVFRLYDRVQLSDYDLLPSSLYFRVDRIEYDILYNTYKIELGDGSSVNPWNAIAQYMKKIMQR